MPHGDDRCHIGHDTTHYPDMQSFRLASACFRTTMVACAADPEPTPDPTLTARFSGLYVMAYTFSVPTDTCKKV